MNNFDFNLTNIVDVAVGRFTLQTEHDQWVFDRTRMCPSFFAQGQWRYRLDVQTGVIYFDFEDRADADKFRAMTATSTTLITCM